jgi:hypothetical protein
MVTVEDPWEEKKATRRQSNQSDTSGRLGMLANNSGQNQSEQSNCRWNTQEKKYRIHWH